MGTAPSQWCLAGGKGQSELALSALQVPGTVLSSWIASVIPNSSTRYVLSASPFHRWQHDSESKKWNWDRSPGRLVPKAKHSPPTPLALPEDPEDLHSSQPGSDTSRMERFWTESSHPCLVWKHRLSLTPGHGGRPEPSRVEDKA